eukprot:423487_1
MSRSQLLLKDKAFLCILLLLFIIEAIFLSMYSDKVLPLFTMKLFDESINGFFFIWLIMFPIGTCCGGAILCYACWSDFTEMLSLPFIAFLCCSLMFISTMMVVLYCISPQTTIYGMIIVHFTLFISYDSNWLFITTMEDKINYAIQNLNEIHETLFYEKRVSKILRLPCYNNPKNLNYFFKTLFHFVLSYEFGFIDTDHTKNEYFPQIKQALNGKVNVEKSKLNATLLLKRWLGKNRTWFICYFVWILIFQCIFWILSFNSINISHNNHLLYYILLSACLFFFMIISLSTKLFSIWNKFYLNISWLDRKYYNTFGHVYHHRMGKIRDPKIRSKCLWVIDRYYVMIRYVFYVECVYEILYEYIPCDSNVINTILVFVCGVETEQQSEDYYVVNTSEFCSYLFECVDQQELSRIKNDILCGMPFGNVGKQQRTLQNENEGTLDKDRIELEFKDIPAQFYVVHNDDYFNDIQLACDVLYSIMNEKQ